jgi:alpha-mannosidase
MDQGVHEVRLLVAAGEVDRIRRMAAGLADWLNAPPFALAHFPFGAFEEEKGRSRRAGSQKYGDIDLGGRGSLLSCEPVNIRLTACKRSWDRRALVIRVHETSGLETTAALKFRYPRIRLQLTFRPFEIKTIRLEKSGSWREVRLISESRLT